MFTNCINFVKINTIMSDVIRSNMKKLIIFLNGRIMSGNFQQREYLKSVENRNFIFTAEGYDDGVVLSISDLGGMMDGAKFPEQEKWTEEALAKIYNIDRTYTTSWKINDEWAFNDVEKILLENGKYTFISARIEPVTPEAVEAVFECVGSVNSFTANIGFKDFADESGKTLFFPEFSFDTKHPDMPVTILFHACSGPDRRKPAKTGWPDLFFDELRKNDICKFETVINNTEYKMTPSDAAALFFTLASGKAGIVPAALIAIKNRY